MAASAARAPAAALARLRDDYFDAPGTAQAALVDLPVVPLMSFEDAMRFAILFDTDLRAAWPALQQRLLPSAKKFASELKASSSAPTDHLRALGEEELVAVFVYVRDAGFPRILNARLGSSDNRAVLDPLLPLVKLLLTAVYKLPRVSGTVVYRGHKGDARDQLPPGQTHVGRGFGSCTRDMSVLYSDVFAGRTAAGEPQPWTVVSIRVCAAFDVSRFAAGSSSAAQCGGEVLLAPATTITARCGSSLETKIHSVTMMQAPFAPQQLVVGFVQAAL